MKFWIIPLHNSRLTFAGEGSTDGPTGVSTEGNAGNTGGGNGGNNGGGNSGGGNGGDGGNGGAGGNGGGNCSCSEWDFPGECGTDGMIFR